MTLCRPQRPLGPGPAGLDSAVSETAASVGESREIGVDPLLGEGHARLLHPARRASSKIEPPGTEHPAFRIGSTSQVDLPKG